MRRSALPHFPKSETTALISGFAAGSILTFTSSLLLAKLSFCSPHSPLGSAAVTAMPAIITHSNRSFHSSGVKFVLLAMGCTLYDRSNCVAAIVDDQAKAASLSFRTSIVGFNISATPGIANTLSNTWLSVGMNGLTNPARSFRCSGDSCPVIPPTLSI